MNKETQAQLAKRVRSLKDIRWKVIRLADEIEIDIYKTEKE